MSGLDDTSAGSGIVHPWQTQVTYVYAVRWVRYDLCRAQATPVPTQDLSLSRSLRQTLGPRECKQKNWPQHTVVAWQHQCRIDMIRVERWGSHLGRSAWVVLQEQAPGRCSSRACLLVVS